MNGHDAFEVVSKGLPSAIRTAAKSQRRRLYGTNDSTIPGGVHGRRLLGAKEEGEYAGRLIATGGTRSSIRSAIATGKMHKGK